MEETWEYSTDGCRTWILDSVFCCLFWTHRDSWEEVKAGASWPAVDALGELSALDIDVVDGGGVHWLLMVVDGGG